LLTRRSFTLGSAAFAGLALACAPTGLRLLRQGLGYGALVPDPAGLLDLPQGFAYRIISRFGDAMDDGYRVPDHADGMGAFRLDSRRMALVRNHELRPSHGDRGPFAGRAPAGLAAFDAAGGAALPGGTSTIVYDYRSGRVEAQYLSLLGTIRNCAGGVTPWGSWLTCEEDVTRAGSGLGQDHGWVFEVPAAHRGLADPVALTALGRFNHEAAIVDPRTGIVYLTEDREDGLFYRLLPERPGELRRGGRLQALAFADRDRPADSRNDGQATLPLQAWQPVRWIDLDQVESPGDDLRERGHAQGAVLFARGEGIHVAERDLYFCCTSGGGAGLGQVMRYRPSRFEGRPDESGEPGQLQLFVESADPATLNYADNLIVAPTGHLVLCEDQGTPVERNHLRGVTPDGSVYPLARLHEQTELAGACFSPDGATMFVNLYHPGRTLAISGPWASVGG
jgi:secreted PhoX family phosphatase